MLTKNPTVLEYCVPQWNLAIVSLVIQKRDETGKISMYIIDLYLTGWIFETLKHSCINLLGIHWFLFQPEKTKHTKNEMKQPYLQSDSNVNSG